MKRNPTWLYAADHDHLKWLYLDCEMSCYDIANLFGCGASTVKRYLFNTLGIEPRPANQGGNSPFFKHFNGSPEHLKAIKNSCRKTLRVWNASERGKKHLNEHLRKRNRAPMSSMQKALVVGLRNAGWAVEDTQVNMEILDEQTGKIRYFLDIADAECQLCVEVDGWTHTIPARIEKDRKRDAWLTERGWVVLRFTDEAVGTDVNAVVQTVLEARRKLHERREQPAAGCYEIV